MFRFGDYERAIGSLLRAVFVLLVVAGISVPVALYYVIPDMWSRLQPIIHEWTKEK